MARYFNGTRSCYLMVTDMFDLSFYPCTLVGWVKYDGGGIADGTVFARYFSNTSTLQYDDALAITVATGKPCGRGLRSGGGGSYRINYSGTADTNWHHMALVMHSNTNRDFYYDGALVGSDTTTVLATQPQASLGVGACTLLGSPPDLGENCLKGAVADVAIYTSALNAGDISTLAAGQRPGRISPATLKGWWPLTQGGDLNSVIPYPPFTAFGAVTEVADPVTSWGAPLTAYPLPPVEPAAFLDHEALYHELANDPEDLGYGPLLSVEDYVAVADILNEPNALWPIANEACTFRQWTDAIDMADWNTVDNEIVMYDFLIKPFKENEGIDFRSGNLVALLSSKLAGTATLTNWQTQCFTRPSSRAETLFGRGIIVNSTDVSYAWITYG